MNYIENIRKIKELILFILKLLLLGLCIYYIYKAKDYEISWNLYYFLPGNWLVYLNQILSNIGTYLLLLPIILIITSWLIESKVLNIIITFFSVGGGIFTIYKGLTLGNLIQGLNLRIFTVYHSLSLETKKELFLNEYHKLIVNLSTIKDISPENLMYLKEQVKGNNFNKYEEVLKTLPINDLKAYVNRIFNNLNLEYLALKKPSYMMRTFNWLQDHVTISGCIKVSLVTITVVICYGLFKWLTSTENTILPNIMINAVDASKVATEISTTHLRIDQEVLVVIKEFVKSSTKLLQNFITQQNKINLDTGTQLIKHENLLVLFGVKLYSIEQQIKGLMTLTQPAVTVAVAQTENLI